MTGRATLLFVCFIVGLKLRGVALCSYVCWFFMVLPHIVLSLIPEGSVNTITHKNFTQIFK